MKTWCYDLETNGLLGQMDTIHCGVFISPEGEITAFHDSASISPRDGSLEDMGEFVANIRARGDRVCAHNGLMFDDVVMEAFLGIDVGKSWDSQLISQLCYPDMLDLDWHEKVPDMPMKFYGSPALGAWGWRLGEHKGDYTGGWKNFSQSMLDYCIQDTKVTRVLIDHLEPKLARLDPGAAENEMEFGRNLSGTMQAGVQWDGDAADRLLVRLQGDRAEALDKIQVVWPDEEVTHISPVRKKKRTVTVSFNPRSGKQVREKFQPWGYKPPKKTKTGLPSTEEDCLADFIEELRDREKPERAEAVDAVRLYRIIGNRLSKLEEGQTAFRKFIDDTSRLRFRIKPIGTYTGRCAHSSPPVGQVTTVLKPYGKEFRELFTVAEGYTLLGWDMKSQEMRLLGHELYPYDDGEFAELAATGDPHEFNRVVFSDALDQEVSRFQAKQGFYALLYGASPTRLARTFKCSAKRAAQAIKIFKERLKIGPLVRDIEDTLLSRGMAIKTTGKWGKPWLKINRGASLRGLDGRRVPVRSSHSLLNFTLQSDGAIVVKHVTNGIAQEARKAGMLHHLRGQLRDYGMVLHTHDEGQFEVLPEYIKVLRKICLSESERVTETLNLRCPMAGDVKTGQNWLDTH